MISNKMDNSETVWEGWLTKSPPSTKIWRAVTPRWRRRWFILRNSGELPGQYFLCYYTDRNCRKLKGQIDLDQCEQVDAGLRFENNKQGYQFMFTIKTPKRDYYLSADTEQDMNKWVDCICHVCGLKPFVAEDTVTAVEFEGDNISPAASGITEISPPVTPHTIITGPYIPISECISGKPINNDEDLKQLLLLYRFNKTTTSSVAPMTTSTPTTVASVITNVQVHSYDLPRNLRPPEVLVNASSTPPPSPDSESVFTDDESVLHRSMSVSPSKKPHVNWETFPRPSDSSMDGEDSPNLLYNISNAITMHADRVFAKVPPSNAALILAPPRPPKPSYLASGESQPQYNQRTEENTSIVSAPATINPSGGSNNTPLASVRVAEPSQDEMYDIPRSHLVAGDTLKKFADSSGGAATFSSHHCYSDAAPNYVTSDTNNVFRYDFAQNATNPDEVLDSPHSETGSTSFTNSLSYSNLPSPSLSLGNNGVLVLTPPVVNRDLKPGLKWSDSTGGSNEPSPILIGYPRPIIDRNKKPTKSAPWKKIHETGRNAVIDVDGSIVLASPPIGSLGRQKLRSGPSQISPNNMMLKSHNSGFATSQMHRRHSSSDDRLASPKDEFQVHQRKNLLFHPSSYRQESSKKFGKVQYLDLDLESTNNNGSGPSLVKKSSENVHTPSTATVYKTVDFLKTEAFNRTRIEIEEERNRLCMAAESAL